MGMSTGGPGAGRGSHCAGLEVTAAHEPLGREDDPIAWVNETRSAPSRIDILMRAREGSVLMRDGLPGYEVIVNTASLTSLATLTPALSSRRIRILLFGLGAVTAATVQS